MTRAWAQVREECGALSITVRAENLQRAVELTANHYPGRAVGLRFPVGPEAFFIDGSRLRMDTSGPKTNEADERALWRWAAGEGRRLLTPREMPQPPAPVPGRVTR